MECEGKILDFIIFYITFDNSSTMFKFLIISQSYIHVIHFGKKKISNPETISLCAKNTGLRSGFNLSPLVKYLRISKLLAETL